MNWLTNEIVFLRLLLSLKKKTFKLLVLIIVCFLNLFKHFSNYIRRPVDLTFSAFVSNNFFFSFEIIFMYCRIFIFRETFFLYALYTLLNPSNRFIHVTYITAQLFIACWKETDILVNIDYFSVYNDVNFIVIKQFLF